MKITVIASDYPYEDHQMYVFVEQLVNAMVDQGNELIVVASQNIAKIILGRQKKLPFKTFASTKLGAKYLVYRPYYISFGLRFPFLRKSLDKIRSLSIRNIVKKIDSDVIYCHFWDSALLIKGYVQKRHLPLFVACGEGDNALEEMVEELGKKGVDAIKSIVTGVISVSSENKRKCLEYGLIDEDRIAVEPNCVDTTLFYKRNEEKLRKDLGINDGDFTIVFVGGFIPRKGPDRLADAISKLNDPHIKSIFVGKEFEGYNYSFYCDGIVFKGTASHNDIPKLLNCADVFVLPTQKEGCCNSIVEALACGLPVISSNGAFNDDILDDSNSIRVNVDDVDDIAVAIKTLKDDIKKRQNMSKTSMERIDSYSIEERAKRILSFIKKMI